MNNPLASELKPIDIPLNSIYLDPNNPRFVGAKWTYVSDDEIDNKTIQDGCRQKLVDEYGIDKLRRNMEQNGYLPIDRVIVREFKKEKFVVLEGNRRICAAQLTAKYGLDGTTIDGEILKTFGTIPSLQYIGTDTQAAWVFQGLRHITGIADWSAFNKAKLIVEEMENNSLSLTEVGKKFGLSGWGAGQWARGYWSFTQATEESDYITEIDERSYVFFQELHGKSSGSVKNWLEWDEETKKFKNISNLNEFVGWLYPRPEEIEEGIGEPLGDWDNRVLKRRDDLRQVAFLKKESTDEFELFRQEKDIEKAYSMALTKKYEKIARESYEPGKEAFSHVNECIKAIDNLPIKLLKDKIEMEKFVEELGKLKKGISDFEELLKSS